MRQALLGAANLRLSSRCSATGHRTTPHIQRHITCSADMAPQLRRPARRPIRRRAHRPRPLAGMVCKHGGPFGRAGRRFRSEGAHRPRPVRRRPPTRRFRSAGPRGRRGQLRVHTLAGPVKVALLLVLEHRIESNGPRKGRRDQLRVHALAGPGRRPRPSIAPARPAVNPPPPPP